jgi:hypothetical protein
MNTEIKVETKKIIAKRTGKGERTKKRRSRTSESKNKFV